MPDRSSSRVQGLLPQTKRKSAVGQQGSRKKGRGHGAQTASVDTDCLLCFRVGCLGIRSTDRLFRSRLSGGLPRDGQFGLLQSAYPGQPAAESAEQLLGLLPQAQCCVPLGCGTNVHLCSFRALPASPGAHAVISNVWQQQLLREELKDRRSSPMNQSRGRQKESWKEGKRLVVGSVGGLQGQ